MPEQKISQIEIIGYQLTNMIEESKKSIQKLHEDIDRNPAYVFEWGVNYYSPLHRGMLATQILSGRDNILSRGEASDETEAFKMALTMQTDQIRRRLLHNEDRSNSTCAFHNACADAKRNVESNILPEFEAMLRHLG